MKNKQSLEQEYKNLKRQETPDIWGRIQENLQEHPDRIHHACPEDVPAAVTSPGPHSPRPKGSPLFSDTHAAPHSFLRFPSAHAVCKMSAAAVAVILLAALEPWKNPAPVPHSGAMEQTAAPQTEAAAETVDIFSENAGKAQEGHWSSMADDQTASVSESMCQENPEQSPDFSDTQVSSASSSGALSYSQLSLAPYEPLPIPAHARTIQEDAMYFSEDILENTELLCQGTIANVWLNPDQNETAVNISYEIILEQIYYSQDYVTEGGPIVVTAPIIEAASGSGTASHVLYQMQTGATYLLPLQKRDGNWELLCPFAPQVQVTKTGAYLFHSGYVTLADSRSRIVIGNPEGVNDYYYDKMLLRDDDNFLSDFVTLTKHTAFFKGE